MIVRVSVVLNRTVVVDKVIFRVMAYMTLKMTSAQVVETSVIVNNNSSFQNYTNPDDHTQQTTDTPGFKPFTIKTEFNSVGLKKFESKHL